MVKEQIEQETICHILERRSLKLKQRKMGVGKLLLLMFRVLLERHVTECWLLDLSQILLTALFLTYVKSHTYI